MTKKDLNNFGKNIQLVIREYNKRVEEMIKPLVDITKMPAIQEMQKNILDAQKAIGSIAARNKEFMNQISSMSGRVDSLNLLSDHFKNIHLQFSTKLSQDIILPLLENVRIDTPQLNITDENFTRLIDQLIKADLYSELDKRVDELEKGHSTVQGVRFSLSDILAIITLIITLIQISDNSTEEALQDIQHEQQVTNQLLENFNSLFGKVDSLVKKIEGDKNALLVAKKEAPLRKGPKNDSDTVLTVFKGQYLDLLDEKDGWYKVKFYNFDESESGIGWIYEEHVELLEISKRDEESKASSIPETWKWVKIKDVSEKSQYGFTTKAVDEGNVHLLRTTDITSGEIDWKNVPFCRDDPDDLDKYRLEEGDILISRAGSVGESFLVHNLPYDNVVFASYLIRFKPTINQKFFKYFLESPKYWNTITEEKSGIAVPNVNATKLNAIEFPLLPPDTQHRIVEKIEELFSDLDNGVENLKKAKRQLETYRQAVLKAAFEGKFTKQWREQQEDLPSPEELKQQIEEERKRQREKELEAWRQEVKVWKEQGESGRKPRKPRKPKDVESISKNELEKLHYLPENWMWIRLGKLIGKPKYGTSQKCSYDFEGEAVLRIPNIGNGYIDSDDLKYSEFTEEEKRKYNLKKGDLLTIRSNGSIDLVGKCAIVREQDEDFLFAGYLIRLRPYSKMVDSKYLYYVLNTITLRRQIENKAKSTSGVHNINSGELQHLIIPIASLEEQQEIVNRIESTLSLIDQLKRTVKEELSKTEALRQSILKKAFEGKLV